MERRKSTLWNFCRWSRKENSWDFDFKIQETFYKIYWPLVKEVNDLLEYFPDYKPKQYPDRSFMNSILATLRFDQVKRMIENIRKNRELENKREDDELLYINKELLKEIEFVPSQKRKYCEVYNDYSCKKKSRLIYSRDQQN